MRTALAFALGLSLLPLAACGGAQPTAPTTMETPTPEQLYERGIEFARRRDWSRAEEYLQLSMDQGIPPERVLPPLLRVCIGGSRYAAALRYATPYLESHPDAVGLRTLVAVIRLSTGETARGESDLRAVIALAPDQVPQAYFLLGRSLLASDRDQARELLEHYLAIAPSGDDATEARGLLAELDLPTEASDAPRAPRSDHHVMIIDAPSEPAPPPSAGEAP